MIRYFLAALLFAGPAFGQSVTEPPVTGTPGNITSFGTNGVAGDSGTALRVSIPYSISGAVIASQFQGVNAGAAYPTATESTGYGSVGYGAGAFQSMSASNLEGTAVGNWACQYITTANAPTCIGMHAAGSEKTSPGITAIGNDAMRDSISFNNNGLTVAVGNQAMDHGNPGMGTVAIGAQALLGISSGIMWSGAVSAGDTITVNINSSVIGLSGLPFSSTYTVQAGDTLTTIASHFGNVIGGSINGPSYGILAGYVVEPDGTTITNLGFPGSSSSGWGLIVTVSVTGTENYTILNGSAPTATTALGYRAGFAPGMQSPTQNTLLGFMVGNWLTAGAYNTLTGALVGENLTNGGYNTITGASSGLAMTTGYSNSIFGQQSGTKITTGGRNTIIGNNVASTTLVTGSNNIIIGTTAAQDTIAANTNNEINVGGLLFYNTASVAAPAVTGGTSPTIDSHANNRSGTVTFGSGTVASGTITFAGSGYSVWNHCRVTPQSALTSFSYSYTKTAITVTASSLTSAVIDYDCDGY